ncbi:hypothetical protein [Sinanaerobacter chloroacetimidivorans]|uniref:hypothetical protein n=1 Tax=Sinanaerobacter chloroacetimidivorans TaxID=2818044 RepID=UPI001D03BBCD|nr:hypothetical protein [Sinanaerobacter chloroacetimidivorans]
MGIKDGFGEDTLLSSDLDSRKTAHDEQCANDIIDLISMNFSEIFMLIFKIWLGGATLRKKTAFIGGLAILVLISAFYVSREGRVIGEITGAEWDVLTIGETEYRQINGLDFTIADKGKYLGKAKYNESAVRLYSVKGDTEDKYIYAFWDWEGFFYVLNE